MKKIFITIFLSMFMVNYTYAEIKEKNNNEIVFKIEEWRMNGDSKDTLLFEGVIKQPEILNHCQIMGYLDYSASLDKKEEFWTLKPENSSILCIGQKIKKFPGYLRDSVSGKNYISKNSKKELYFIVDIEK